MSTMHPLDLIQQKKLMLAQEEKALIEKRKFEIAQLAESYGLLSLPAEELKSAFIKLSYQHHALQNQD